VPDECIDRDASPVLLDQLFEYDVLLDPAELGFFQELRWGRGWPLGFVPHTLIPSAFACHPHHPCAGAVNAA